MNSKINWGIIGLGKIARLFASDLQLSENAILHSVASRDIEKAAQFSMDYQAVKHYGNYEELARDPDIDIVYIATPHVFHYEQTMMCLKYGKPVLCEKPMGISSGEVKRMIGEANYGKSFLMEALWTRFIPATEKLIELLKNKVIGDIIFMRADFGFRADPNPGGRLFNKKLGGGALLDIGIYPVYLSLLALGFPSDIKTMARVSSPEVDSYISMLFDYENSAKAILESTFEADTPTEAYIYGTNGVIKLHSRFHHSEKISLYQNGELKEVFDIKHQGEGYIYEIEEVNQCLINQQTESSKLPHSLSLNLAMLLEQVKDKAGLSSSKNI
ncbi:MAG: Gfo/Idh/MocA family oxidoreductase [Bacteroidota bacterium]|nr:Gfo/Idh/MocA family oxidoreductase [Bacteroidota bacterium]